MIEVIVASYQASQVRPSQFWVGQAKNIFAFVVKLAKVKTLIFWLLASI